MAAVRRAVRILKATLVGGLLFLVPVILLLVVLRHGVELGKKVVKPIVAYTPIHSVGGVAVATLASVGLLLLIALGIGVFAQTRPGRRVKDWLEDTILGRVPAYAVLRGLVGGAESVDRGNVAPALAWVEDCWVFAFVMEVHEDGHRTVFIPAAPTPLSGAIYFLPEDRVRLLDVPLPAVMKAIRRLGDGSAALLGSRLSAKLPR